MMTIRQMHRRLDEMSVLQDDWDSYGGAAPTARAIAVARDLLCTVDGLVQSQSGRDVKLLHLGPLPSGGVQLEWRLGGVEIEVEVDPQGDLSYLLVERKQGAEARREGEHVPKQTIIDLVLGRKVLSERS